MKHVQALSKGKPLLALNEGQFDVSQLVDCVRSAQKKQILQCVGVFIYGSDGKTCCGS